GYYHPGVGTMGNPMARNKISSAWSIVKGLAFGGGLLDNVGDAYRFLMNAYEGGDDIYLFGFSRGAYTVRAGARHAHVRRIARGRRRLDPIFAQNVCQANTRR